MRLRRIWVIAFSLVAVQVALAPQASAESSISIRIDRLATLSPDGSITFTAHVSCALDGTEDFREGLAGATQSRTGAEAEGSLSPDIACDGVERAYTAGIGLISESAFKRGRASAGASVIACNTVDDEQVCVQASAQRQVIVR